MASASRLDVALELMKLEEVLADAKSRGKLSEKAEAETNRSFDALTALFFAGRNADAIKRLQQLRSEVLTETVSDLGKALDCLKVEIDPGLIAADDRSPIKLRVRQLHAGGDPTLLRGKTLVIALRRASGDNPLACIDQPGAKPELITLASIEVSATEGTAPGEPEKPNGAFRIERTLDAQDHGLLAARRAIPGPHSVQLSLMGSSAERRLAGVVQITPSSPSQASGKYQRLFVETAARQAATGGQRPHPLVEATLKSRLALLAGSPSSNDAAASLLDRAVLQRLDNEVVAVARGFNPYANFRGTWQLTLGPDYGDVPVWIHDPRPSPAVDGAIPSADRPGLLIALHGAGGDEGMFPLSYGSGAIKNLCKSHNLVLASPRTEPFIGKAELLDVLIARVGVLVDIDPRRIYVIGHSMGAIAAAGLAPQRTLTLAGVVCLAGGPMAGAPERCSPMLVLGAELDGLVSPKRLEPAARRWYDAGLPIQYATAPGLGHTLMVGNQLPRAMAWLAQQRLGEAKPPGQWEAGQ